MTYRGLLVKSAFICVHLWLTLLLCGCSQKPAEQPLTTAGPGPGAPSRTIEIAVVPKGIAFDFWLAVKAGAEQAGQEEGVTITWNGPSKETETDKQIATLENA